MQARKWSKAYVCVLFLGLVHCSPGFESQRSGQQLEEIGSQISTSHPFSHFSLGAATADANRTAGRDPAAAAPGAAPVAPPPRPPVAGAPDTPNPPPQAPADPPPP